MRRALILTVSATSSVVLLAMLIPLALLIRNYDVENRLAQAALEAQSTETVVSRQDRGMVSVYLERINSAGNGTVTTVLYPDGIGVGPVPGESAAVAAARNTGQARVDDISGGARLLVPVNLDETGMPDQTAVVRVDVKAAPFPSRVHVAWGVLALLGLVIMAGALLLADRISLWFVRPIVRMADQAGRLGGSDGLREVEVSGPTEVKELGRSLNRLVSRIETLIERERESNADLSHRLRTPITALRLNVDSLPQSPEKGRLEADVDRLHGMVDHLIHEARRSQREGVSARVDAMAVLTERAEFWAPLAEEGGRDFVVSADRSGRFEVNVSRDDLEAMVDVLLDNVFSHTPADAAVAITLDAIGGRLRMMVDDAGPGFPEGVDLTKRGRTQAGSTGLGLSIAESTARATGGELRVERSPRGGARVIVELGAAG